MENSDLAIMEHFFGQGRQTSLACWVDTVDWIVQNENEVKGCLLVFVGIPCFIIIMFRKRKREKERKKQK